MSFERLEKDMNIIAQLDDEPNDVGGLSAAELKAKFDEGGNAVKDAFNALIDALEAGTGAASIGAKDADGNDSTVQDALDAVPNKMDKANPTGTGSFSLNRIVGASVGANSFAAGSGVQASGDASHAEGSGTYAIGLGSHTEGSGTYAGGSYSHAEGGSTSAIGNYSHAEGAGTQASGDYSHAEGIGTFTTSASTGQHVQGKYNVADAAGAFADIVGNGTSTTKKNIEATTWAGDKKLKGSVYVGCNDDSTGGTKLAAIPEPPTTNGVYTLKATVASGPVSYQWVAV